MDPGDDSRRPLDTLRPMSTRVYLRPPVARDRREFLERARPPVLHKPFRVDQFLEAVHERLLERSRQAGTGATPSA